MSKKAVYKGKEYNSRSQCALAMLSDGYRQKYVAEYLGISFQAVSAVKKRLESRVVLSIRKAKKRMAEDMKRINRLNEKVNHLTMVYSKIVDADVKKRKTNKVVD